MGELQKTSPEALQRVSQGRIIRNEAGSMEMSLYPGEELEPSVILQSVNRLKVSFPKMSNDFFNVLAERVVANKFSNKRLQDAVNYVLDNFQYKELNISDIVKFDKRAKLYSYNEVCNLVTKSQASFSDFQIVELEGNTYRVKKTELTTNGHFNL
jgi:hypothetical protein